MKATRVFSCLMTGYVRACFLRARNFPGVDHRERQGRRKRVDWWEISNGIVGLMLSGLMLSFQPSLGRQEGVHGVHLVGRAQGDVAGPGQEVGHGVPLAGEEPDVLGPLANLLDVVKGHGVMFLSI